MLDDVKLAAKLWIRVRNLVPSTIFVREKKETWHATRLNSKFRFCRYVDGQFFTKHYDEQVILQEDKSFYTMMMYLNQVKEEKGGTTRFFINDTEEKLNFEINPEEGSLLLLWQKGMLHDGAPLKNNGIKYILRTEVMYRKSVKIK